jgi:hypothetical protein
MSRRWFVGMAGEAVTSPQLMVEQELNEIEWAEAV